MLAKKFAGLCLCLCAACTQATAIALPPAASPTAPASYTAAPTLITLPTLTPRAPPVAPTQTQTLPPTPTQTPTQTPVPPTSLLFTGDISLGRCVYAFSKAADDMALPFRKIADTLRSADITVGSLDGSISDYNPVP